MSVDLAAKLQATIFALGCSSRKGLVARFRLNNAATTLELESLHKWMQGRASPRGTAFYSEWARILGVVRSGDWLASCTLGDFVAEVAATTGMPEHQLVHGRTMPDRKMPGASPTLGLLGGLGGLAGVFACYSHAFAPRREGWLIRGSLRMDLVRGAKLHAHYSETLSVGPVSMAGPVSVNGRTLSVSMLETTSEVPLFLVLHVPGSPANLISGLLVCSTLQASEPLPSCSPFLAVRVPDRPGLDDSNRYFAGQPGAIAADLETAGITLGEPASFDAGARAFLGPKPQRAYIAMQTQLASHLADDPHDLSSARP